jgi:broad specificity phosphatase PhoE
MRYLVFIRHSQSQPEAGVPAREWRLTAEGRRRCIPLAVQLTPYNLDVIVTSTEPKSIETGKLAAQKLAIPCQTAENLHEQERETAPYFDTKAEFLATVNAVLSKPAELVFGEETGRDAQKRFAGAVESVINAYPRDNIAIVTHGTVLSLFVSQLTGKEIYTFWLGLGMPAIVAFSYPAMKLLAQVNEIT